MVAHTLSLRRQGQEDLCDYTDSWVYEVSIVNSYQSELHIETKLRKRERGGGNVLLYMYFIIN